MLFSPMFLEIFTKIKLCLGSCVTTFGRVADSVNSILSFSYVYLYF